MPNRKQAQRKKISGPEIGPCGTPQDEDINANISPEEDLNLFNHFFMALTHVLYFSIYVRCLMVVSSRYKVMSSGFMVMTFTAMLIQKFTFLSYYHFLKLNLKQKIMQGRKLLAAQPRQN